MTCNCSTVLCAEHQQSFLDILADIPDRLATMTVSITKQAVMGGQGGKPTNDDDRPLPVNLGAADARLELRAQLVNTALRVKHCFQERPQASTIGEACQWLRQMMPRMVQHPEAITWYANIADAYHHTTRLIDHPPERIRAGMCDCGEVLYAVAGNQTVKCRACDTRYDVEDLQYAELAKVMDYTDTAAMVIKVMERAGTKIKFKRLTSWADRGQVTFTTDERGRIFRVGDVLDALAKMDKATV